MLLSLSAQQLEEIKTVHPVMHEVVERLATSQLAFDYMVYGIETDEAEDAFATSGFDLEYETLIDLIEQYESKRKLMNHQEKLVFDWLCDRTADIVCGWGGKYVPLVWAEWCAQKFLGFKTRSAFFKHHVSRAEAKMSLTHKHAALLNGAQ